jgi:hypothetical protein
MLDPRIIVLSGAEDAAAFAVAVFAFVSFVSLLLLLHYVRYGTVFMSRNKKKGDEKVKRCEMLVTLWWEFRSIESTRI